MIKGPPPKFHGTRDNLGGRSYPSHRPGTDLVCGTKPQHQARDQQQRAQRRSCVSATDCIAVGEQAGRTAAGTLVSALIESWNGTAWSVVPSPQPGTGLSTACLAPQRQAAPPSASTSLTAQRHPGGILERHQVVVTPNPGPGSELLGVSCVSPTACTAVGDQLNSQGYYQTLTEFWNGTRWSTVPSPDKGHGTNENFLSGVSCVSATACTAVGQYGTGSSAPLIESWNGTRWTIVPAPTGTTVAS